MEKLLYRPAEVQTAIGVGNTKFWELVKNGSLETRKIAYSSGQNIFWNGLISVPHHRKQRG